MMVHVTLPLRRMRLNLAETRACPSYVYAAEAVAVISRARSNAGLPVSVDSKCPE